jgi:hypothetical protein
MNRIATVAAFALFLALPFARAASRTDAEIVAALALPKEP